MRALGDKAAAAPASRMEAGVPSCRDGMYGRRAWSSCGKRLQNLAILFMLRLLAGWWNAGCRPIDNEDELKEKF